MPIMTMVAQRLSSHNFLFLCCLPVLCVPVGGTLALVKTLYKTLQSFSWKGVNPDTAISVTACKICRFSKPAQNPHYGMMSPDVASRALEKLFIDFVEKFPRWKSGNTYALVCVDAFTKFV
jgi:hypothetical protein